MFLTSLPLAKFSFLMVIIPILGEAFLNLIKGDFAVEASGLSATVLVTGFLAAFVSGTIACKWMISLVSKGKLIYFAIYCLVLGLGTVIYSLVA